jgi:hypothetical protein
MKRKAMKNLRNKLRRNRKRAELAGIAAQAAMSTEAEKLSGEGRSEAMVAIEMPKITASVKSTESAVQSIGTRSLMERPGAESAVENSGITSAVERLGTESVLPVVSSSETVSEMGCSGSATATDRLEALAEMERSATESAAERLGTKSAVERSGIASALQRSITGTVKSNKSSAASASPKKRPRPMVINERSGTAANDIYSTKAIPEVRSSGKEVASEISVVKRAQTSSTNKRPRLEDIAKKSRTAAKGAKRSETAGTIEGLKAAAKRSRSRTAQLKKQSATAVTVETSNNAGVVKRSRKAVIIKTRISKTAAIVEERPGRALVALANDELIVIDPHASFMTLLAKKEVQGLSRLNGKAILCLDVEVVSDGVYSQFTQLGAVLSVEGQISTFEAKVCGSRGKAASMYRTGSCEI